MSSTSRNNNNNNGNGNADAATTDKEIALSVEETNKLRLSLGLKPLELVDKRNQAAEDNYARHREQAARVEEEQAMKERLERSKMKRIRERKLSGTALGDMDADAEEVDDAAAWVERSKRRQKEIAEAKEEEEKRQQRKGAKKRAAYTSEHLTGLTVAHDIEELAADGENILVLKDASVLGNDDGDDDELVSVQVAERELLRKTMEGKRGPAQYNARKLMEGEEGEEGNGLLSQYDEEILGAKKKRFTLTGTQINVDDVVKSRAKRPDRATVSLEFDNMREVNDYMAPEEDVNIAFRKSKKKNSKKDGGKAKRTTRVATDRDEEDGFELSKIVDGTPDGGSSSKRATKPRTSTTAPDNFVDDDDLQFALAQSRKVTMKKKSAEEIAREMAEADAADGDDAAATPPTGSIVLSSTTEFVRNLSTTSVVVKPKEVGTKEKVAAAATVAASDVTMSSVVDGGAMDVDASTEAVPVVEEPEAEEDAKLSTITEEPLVANGLAATLALLNQRGLLEKQSADSRIRDLQILRNQQYLDRKRLATDRALEDQARDRVKLAERGYNMTRAEEEERFDRVRQLELEERFKDYKPNIKLEYRDEQGRILPPKDAYKMLSHTFHGAGSHKKKLEKYERKRAAEQEARVTTDEVKSTLADALRAVQKQTGSAHLVVAVGHKNLAPTKMPSAATGSKKKVVAAVPEKGDTGAAVPTEVATLPVPATTEVPATTAASTTAAPTPAMPPVMKPIGAPGLKPIGFASTTVPSATIQAAPLALGGASRQKVAFGFGGGAASASTASKRKFEPDMGGAMSPQAKKPHQ